MDEKKLANVFERVPAGGRWWVVLVFREDCLRRKGFGWLLSAKDAGQILIHIKTLARVVRKKTDRRTCEITRCDFTLQYVQGKKRIHNFLRVAVYLESAQLVEDPGNP